MGASASTTAALALFLAISLAVFSVVHPIVWNPASMVITAPMTTPRRIRFSESSSIIDYGVMVFPSKDCSAASAADTRMGAGDKLLGKARPL
jgi:hypothetical protein